MNTLEYEAVIGLEIHTELKTVTKLFCGCTNNPFHAPEPNLYICPVCLGLPGTLPVMNRQAAEWTVLVGLALGGEIGWKMKHDPTSPEATLGFVNQRFTKWDRKNYFYPDLPKGYQISQYDLPMCHEGTLEIRPAGEAGIRPIEITRIHLEEDTGKLIHPSGASFSLIDYNRAGVPLMELVTEPVIRSGTEASAFAQEYQLLLRMLGIANADMEKGEMRVEANISVRTRGTQVFGTKVEVKNLNSMKAVREAIEFETERQIEVLTSGGQVAQETRGWNEDRGQTFSQRSKETAADYRYFPEADLPPITFFESDGKYQVSSIKYQGEQGIEITQLKKQLPELPWERRERYQRVYGLPEHDAARLVLDLERSRYFDAARSTQQEVPSEHNRLLANWILNELPDTTIKPELLAELAELVTNGEVTTKLAKELLVKMRSSGQSPRAILEGEGIRVVRDEGALLEIAKKMMAEHPQTVVDYRAGKAQALGFLIGQAMRETKGQADPAVLQQLFAKLLKED